MKTKTKLKIICDICHKEIKNAHFNRRRHEGGCTKIKYKEHWRKNSRKFYDKKRER